jgi:hypothetical protein
MNKQTNKKQNKQTWYRAHSGWYGHRQKQKQTNTHKNSRFRNNRISVLVLLLLQHPVLVLVFKQGFCLSLTRLLGNLTSFSSVFQWQLVSQLLPQWGVAVWVCMLSSGSRDQLCSPQAILLWSCVFTVFVSWGLVSLPRPLSLGQGQWSFNQPLAVSMLWWFADCFSILQCCLTLDVAHWLRRWAMWTATCSISGSSLSPACCQSFCLSSHLFTERSLGDHLLAPPHFSGALTVLHPLCCVLVFSSLFIQFFCFWFFVCEVRGSVCPGDYAGLS